MFYFGQVFVFCRLIDKNILKWMASTNNITYSEQIYKPFTRNHPTLCFWLRRLRCSMLNSYFMKLPKQPSEVFCKDAVLKNVAIFTGKNLHEIFKNTYFEEHLHTSVSELTLWSDSLEICCFRIAFKTILAQ